MPTLKVIHICNYSRIFNLILELVNFVSHQPTLQPKITKEYGFAYADGKKNKKYDRTTLCISNGGFSTNLKLNFINRRSVLS